LLPPRASQVLFKDQCRSPRSQMFFQGSKRGFSLPPPPLFSPRSPPPLWCGFNFLTYSLASSLNSEGGCPQGFVFQDATPARVPPLFLYPPPSPPALWPSQALGGFFSNGRKADLGPFEFAFSFQVRFGFSLGYPYQNPFPPPFFFRPVFPRCACAPSGTG